MTITYTEKGVGLHDAISAAGLRLEQIDNVWVASDEAAVQAVIDAYTLDEAKVLRKADVSVKAKELRDAVVASFSAGELASWSIKRAEMVAYGVSGDPADAPILSAEAAARGATLDSLVARVAGNSTGFGALEAAIAGAEGKHRDAIEACADFAALLAYDIETGWPAV